MTGEPLPISLHFNPKPGIEPHHIPVVGAVTPDPKSLERTCGSGDFLDYLDSKVISQGGCLIAGMVLDPEVAHPRLSHEERPLVERFKGVISLNRLAIAHLRDDAPAGVVIEMEAGGVRNPHHAASVPVDLAERPKGDVLASRPERARARHPSCPGRPHRRPWRPFDPRYIRLSDDKTREPERGEEEEANGGDPHQIPPSSPGPVQHSR